MPEPARCEPTPPTDAPRILHVDDDPLILQLSSRILQVAGFSVTTTVDPAEFRRLSREGGFALFIVDLLMPETDGLSLCRELRLAGRTEPLLVLSCKPLAEAEQKAIAASAAGFMTKPFGPQELIRRVRECLARRP